MNDTDETYQDETESLENSSSVESSEQNGKKNKVVFKTSYPSAGLDRPERRIIIIIIIFSLLLILKLSKKNF
jgi:hypothetical protein